ncbi:MAG: sulfotransferase family 2 domain-containing protein [Acetobacteraceae bacterium]
MIVSHARKFIFFHNPKCAGTSFRDALKFWHDDPFSFWGIFPAPYFRNRIDHTHIRLWELLAQFPHLYTCAESYNSLIFVRNPYLRFLSAMNEHFKKFRPHIDLAAMAPEARIVLVERFLRDALDIARITTDWRFVHFSPQIWQIRLGHRIVPRHIVPMDGNPGFYTHAMTLLGLPALAMPWHNPSPIDLSGVLRSKVVIEFVRDFYTDDFALFATDPALTGLRTLAT